MSSVCDYSTLCVQVFLIDQTSDGRAIWRIGNSGDQNGKRSALKNGIYGTGYYIAYIFMW